MTFKELYEKRYAADANAMEHIIKLWCPCNHFEFDTDSVGHCPVEPYGSDDLDRCERCWNREVPEEKIAELKKELGIVSPSGYDPNLEPRSDTEPFDISEEDDTIEGKFTIATPRILDSGNRREFETGAVRDICEGKGRCDLLPLGVVGSIYNTKTDKIGPLHVLVAVDAFTHSGNESHLRNAIEYFLLHHTPFGDANWSTLFLEVAKHFEEGCKKYGDNNWQKGIPTHCYVDSAVRHYLKYLRGDKDEPHDRAFCWNILCCIWTCIHKPELNDYAVKEQEDG